MLTKRKPNSGDESAEGVALAALAWMATDDERLFAFLTRNARNATLYFGVPSEQVVEVGMRIDL